MCMHARVCMRVLVLVGTPIVTVLCAGGPTAGGPADLGMVEGSCPICIFLMVN